MNRLFFLFLLFLISAGSFGQTDTLRIKTMTREEILQLSQDDLLEMTIEQLLFLSHLQKEHRTGNLRTPIPERL